VRKEAAETILKTLVKNLKEKCSLDLKECFIDGTFVIAKKGLGVGRPSGAKVH
jgi:hypothetical protein